MGPRGQKRFQSKRVITARREMRAARLFYEYDEDDNMWAKEKKRNIHNSKTSSSHRQNHNHLQAKLKKRHAYNIHQDDY
jgi:hypothetical protein